MLCNRLLSFYMLQYPGITVKNIFNAKWHLEGAELIKYLANVVTSARIVLSAILVFSAPLSAEFYILYTCCGISDILDGMIARHTHAESKSGAVLDSIADMVFLFAVMIRLLPVLLNLVSPYIMWAILLIAILRFFAYLVGWMKYHRFVSLHTYLNKVTGAALFALTYFILSANFYFLCAAICTLAAISAAEELIINIKSGRCDLNIKSILDL